MGIGSQIRSAMRPNSIGGKGIGMPQQPSAPSSINNSSGVQQAPTQGGETTYGFQSMAPQPMGGKGIQQAVQPQPVGGKGQFSPQPFQPFIPRFQQFDPYGGMPMRQMPQQFMAQQPMFQQPQYNPYVNQNFFQRQMPQFYSMPVQSQPNIMPQYMSGMFKDGGEVK